MRCARLLARRAAFQPWALESAYQVRSISDRRKGDWRGPRKQSESTNIFRYQRTGASDIPNAAQKAPSLVEQLFPDESKLYDAAQEPSRHVPRLPIERFRNELPTSKAPKPSNPDRWTRLQLQAEMEAAGPGVAALVLRNASPNLTEEDFRRLIPQGRHMEGWTLDQGDILKVIPGRSLSNLEQNNTYYLLFSSKLSAYTYQGHVTRIHILANTQTPTSAMSSIPPPPSYMMDGIDAHAAIQAYALVPPSHRLELRQLKDPLSPLMEALVKHQGFPQIVNRPNKAQHEVRLTMEGPQLTMTQIMTVMRESGKARGLSWSGGENINPMITAWEPKAEVSPAGDTIHEQKKAMQVEGSSRDGEVRTTSFEGSIDVQKRRTPPKVYIIGFHTEQAAVSFVQYWHRRPIEIDIVGSGTWFEDDVAPIANVQLLW